MPTDPAKNDPPTSMRMFVKRDTILYSELFSSVTLGTVVTAPYIYSYSTSPDPLPRALHGMVRVNNLLYVFGGQTLAMGRLIGPNTAPAYSNQLLRYDLATGVWSTLTTSNTPTARCGAAFFLYNSFAYLLFGYGDVNGTPTHIDTFHRYDFTTSTWTLLTTLPDTTTVGRPSNKPPPRQKFASVVRGNLLYIFAGMTDAPLYDLNDVWTLNLTTLQWTFITSNTALRKNDFDIAVIGNLAYLFGGESNFIPVESRVRFNFTTNAVSTVASGQYSNLLPQALANLIANNPNAANTLRERPGAVKSSRSFVLGNGGYANEAPKFFMLGGYIDNLLMQSKVGLYAYNVTGNDWQRLTEVALPYTRGDMNSVSGFALHTTGLAINYTSPTQTSFDYEVYVDDGYSNNTGANYHTGLWKITIRLASGVWSYVGAVRMAGKGTFVANIPNVEFTVNGIRARMTTTPLGSALRFRADYPSAPSISYTTLVVRP